MNSNDGGISVLKRMGVDSSFMSDMQKRYGKYASKVGLNGGTVQKTINAIGKAMNSKAKPPDAQHKPTGFDSSRYPKL